MVNAPWSLVLPIATSKLITTVKPAFPNTLWSITSASSSFQTVFRLLDLTVRHVRQATFPSMASAFLKFKTVSFNQEPIVENVSQDTIWSTWLHVFITSTIVSKSTVWLVSFVLMDTNWNPMDNVVWFPSLSLIQLCSLILTAKLMIWSPSANVLNVERDSSSTQKEPANKLIHCAKPTIQSMVSVSVVTLDTLWT